MNYSLGNEGKCGRPPCLVMLNNVEKHSWLSTKIEWVISWPVPHFYTKFGSNPPNGNRRARIKTTVHIWNRDDGLKEGRGTVLSFRVDKPPLNRTMTPPQHHIHYTAVLSSLPMRSNNLSNLQKWNLITLVLRWLPRLVRTARSTNQPRNISEATEVKHLRSPPPPPPALSELKKPPLMRYETSPSISSRVQLPSSPVFC